MKEIVINTPCGQVKGISKDKVNMFLGIRYGTAERFEYAQEVTHWDGVYPAVHFGSAPLQIRAYEKYRKSDDHYEHEFMEGVSAAYSEDCLFLNIWTPEHALHCPVLVVLYGGGNMTGQADEKEFDGTAFARRGIVVVTLNYRVNVFGLMAIPELTKDDGRCGNYIYYDQHTAFEFIRHNISAFGGNPENMTLIGQSAGAASCETQIKSPLNKGYFKNAIIQSSAGFVTAMKAKDNHRKIFELWNKVYAATGCNSVRELKELPAATLFDAFMRTAGQDQLSYSSVLYDENFTGSFKNKPIDTNIICGITSEDVMPLVLYLMMKLLARKQKHTAPVYSYYFCRQLPGDQKGAWHSADLWYTYGSLSRCWRPFQKEDYELSDKMMDYFESFIRTGNPNGKGRAEWPSCNMAERRYMFFGIGDCRAKKAPVWKIIQSTLFRKRVSTGF